VREAARMRGGQEPDGEVRFALRKRASGALASNLLDTI
jgi:hypothetical protein